MQMEHEKDLYRVSDLALASTLLCLGCRLWATDRSDERRVSFVFERNEGLDEILENYWTGQLRVEPVAFFSAVKQAKNRIYSEY